MTEEKKEQTAKERLNEMFVAFEILNQLNMFPRFRDLMNLHYDIVKNVDPETGAITVVVMEALPEEVAKRMQDGMKIAQQREMEAIKTATPEQIKEIIKASPLKGTGL